MVTAARGGAETGPDEADERWAGVLGRLHASAAHGEPIDEALRRELDELG